MNISLRFLAIILAFGPITFAAEPKAPKPAPPQAKESSRLQFIPAGGPWKGEAAFKGASWTKLGPGLPGGLHLHARAGIGDRFPVQGDDGVIIFEVVLAAGNDDRLLVDVLSKEGPQKVELPRDKPGKVQVAGMTYELLYPSTSVAADKNEKPTTNKATIFVSHRL